MTSQRTEPAMMAKPNDSASYPPLTPATSVAGVPVLPVESPLFDRRKVVACWPKCKNPDAWVDPLSTAGAKFGITNPLRAAAFMAVCAEESGQGNTLVENLNYSVAGLIDTFSAFANNPDLARQYGRIDGKQAANQFWIGEHAYGNREGNGPPGSGDGYGYRGSGAIQRTGARNMAEGAKAFAMDPTDYREWIRTPEGAAMDAGLYWKTNGLNAFADLGSMIGFQMLSGKVNRGSPDKLPKNWDARKAHYLRCMLAYGRTIR